MAGHSHWANIARKKAIVDNKRGKVWSKLAKNIMAAAKAGGGDPDANLRLRYAINDAKAISMPRENIERAVKKGTGDLAGGSLDEVLYEGYGPGGTAVLCEILTDNRNRTAGEIRKIFDSCDGKLGATGCVAWMFDRKGLLVVPADKIGEDELLELALEAGADDVAQVEDKFEVTCDPTKFSDVAAALEAKSIATDRREITRIATNTVDLDAENGRKVLKLMEKLEDHDDVQTVASNFNITEAAMAEMGEA